MTVALELSRPDFSGENSLVNDRDRHVTLWRRFNRDRWREVKAEYD